MSGAESAPAKDLRELIAWLRANPNKASAGFTAVRYHMLMALLEKETRTRFTLVPYRGFPAEMLSRAVSIFSLTHRFNSRHHVRRQITLAY